MRSRRRKLERKRKWYKMALTGGSRGRQIRYNGKDEEDKEEEKEEVEEEKK